MDGNQHANIDSRPCILGCCAHILPNEKGVACSNSFFYL